MNTAISVFLAILLCSDASAQDPQESSKTNPNKRNPGELSYSFTATDIGSKSGTRVKTITVIKNVVGKNHTPLTINSELHKNKDWGSEFRDNFEKFGKIPNLPDVFKSMDMTEEKAIIEDVGQEEVVISLPKEREIPIVEDPEIVSESEEKIDATSEKQELLEDTELIDEGPITLKHAHQSAKSQAAKFRGYHYHHPEKGDLKENNSHTTSLKPPSPKTSESYKIDEINAEAKYQQNYKQTYASEEENTQNIYADYSKSKYTKLSYISSTTVSNPYIAPTRKQLQSHNRFENRSSQNAQVTPEPYIAPSIKKAYSTARPVTIGDSPIPTPGFFYSNNQYQMQRFRGLRY